MKTRARFRPATLIDGVSCHQCITGKPVHVLQVGGYTARLCWLCLQCFSDELTAYINRANKKVARKRKES